MTGVFIGVLLLVVAYLIPVNQKNQIISYEILEKEGWYPAIPILSLSYDTYFHSNLAGVLDNNTDTIMLNEAFNAEEDNPLKIAMSMGGYSYYWHGYVSVLRPLLYFFDYGELRIINGLGQVLLMFFLAHIIYKRKGLPYSLMILTSYALMMPIALAFSLQFSWVFYITYVGWLVLLLKKDFWKINSRYLYFFLIIGMLTSYFDLLTYPLLTWGIPIIWWLIVNSGDMGSAKGQKIAGSAVLQVIISGMHWIAGYALMWISKWWLGTLILKRDIFQDAWEEVFFRAGVAEVGSTTLSERFEAMYINWKHYEYKIYLIILFCWILWGMYRSIKKGWLPEKNSPAFILIGFSSLVWYFVLSNHTAGHHFFTYRIYAISISSFIAVILDNVYHKDENFRKNRIHTLVGWLGISVLAFCITFFIREDVMINNTESLYYDIPVTNGSIIKSSFTPRYPHITEFTLCMKSESLEGSYDISVLYEDEVIYQESIPIESFEGKTYKNIKVDWRLQKGREYTFQITVNDTDGQVYTLVAQTPDKLLKEYKNLNIDGNETDGQILCIINYRVRPSSKKTLLLITLAGIAVLASFTILIYSVLLRKKKVI